MNSIKVLFVVQGVYGRVGSTASFMFPRILSQLGCPVKILVFSEENEVIEKDQNLIIAQSSNFINKVLKIRETIKQFQPEIIHVFYNVEGNSILPFICRVANRNRAKWLIDVRSPPLRLKTVTWWLKYINIVRDFLRQIGYSAITAHVRQSAFDVYHLIVKPLYELPFGVDVGRITKKQWKFDLNGVVPVKRFIYVGSIARLRRLEILLEGICSAKNNLGTLGSFEVHFFGTGDAVEDLRKKLIQLGIDSIVQFKGFIDQSRLFAILHEYDAGVGYVPYEQYMSAPALKIIEYMAANLAVIASDTDGIKIHIDDQVNGMLFKNTVESISSAIVNVVKNGYPHRLLLAAEKDIKKYNWQNIVKNNLLPTYKSLMK